LYLFIHQKKNPKTHSLFHSQFKNSKTMLLDLRRSQIRIHIQIRNPIHCSQQQQALHVCSPNPFLYPFASPSRAFVNHVVGCYPPHAAFGSKSWGWNGDYQAWKGETLSLHMLASKKKKKPLMERWKGKEEWYNGTFFYCFWFVCLGINGVTNYNLFISSHHNHIFFVELNCLFCVMVVVSGKILWV